MPVSILPLFVIVIDRACTGSRTGANECAFPAANQRTCTCADGCPDADAFRGFLFSGFGISMTSVLAASDGYGDRKREHQK
jgi:hypothetical protein